MGCRDYSLLIPWKRAEVINFIKDEYDIDDKHNTTLEKNKISGRNLLTLTEKVIITKHKLPLIVAARILELVNRE